MEYNLILSSEILDVRDGTHDSPKYLEKGYPLITSKNLKGGKVSFENVNYISKEDFDSINKRSKVDKGDILYSMIGTIGNFSLVDDEPKFAIKNVALFKFNNDCLYNRYFYYLLNSPFITNQIVNQQKGGTQKFVTLSILRNLQIPLPDLATQQKIAAVLDKADKLRQYNKQLIEKYDALTQSLFLDMFGSLKGDKVNLGSACKINPKKSEIQGLDRELEVSFLPMANVSDKGDLILSETKKISEVWNGFTYFSEQDVLFAKITPCMENGKGAIAKGLLNGLAFGSTEFHVIRPVENVSNSYWLYHLTMNVDFRKIAEKNMTGSAGQRRVPKDFLEKYKVVIPPISLQNQFAERVQLIEQQKELAQQALQKSEELFNSLLQKAFKGELVAEYEL